MGKEEKKLANIIVMVVVIFASIFAAFVPAVAQPPAPPDGAIYYLVPDNSNVPGYCDTTEVMVMYNTTVPTAAGVVNITYTYCCANITSYTPNTTFFEDQVAAVVPWEGRLTVGFAHWVNNIPTNQPPGVYHLGNFTIHCCNETMCETDLTFDVDTVAYYWDFPNYNEIPFVTDNGTFTCGAPAEETFSKDLYEGWNLISLPLTPSDNSTSSVLASVWDNVSAVYKYNATSKQFESASTMDPGEGYFVYVTQNCTWTYNGTPYTSMSIELKKGLNMVGWLNCSEDITDALSSIAGDYWYVARWNAIERKFEVYNPVAPPVFNDFTTIERGEGYFISMKSDGTLTESC